MKNINWLDAENEKPSNILNDCLVWRSDTKYHDIAYWNGSSWYNNKGILNTVTHFAEINEP